jgi:hypothetical protein
MLPSVAIGQFCVVNFVDLYGIINRKLEKHRGSQVTGSILCYRWTCSLGGNLFWKSRQKSAGCFHCFLAQYYPDNSVHHISCWRNRGSCFLCQEYVNTVACLGALCRWRDVSSASFGFGGVTSDKRCSLFGGSAYHYETSITSYSLGEIPGTL